jgi:hypothetical protein
MVPFNVAISSPSNLVRSHERGAGDRCVDDNLDYFSFRHLVLSRDDDLVLALDSRPASTHQLRGSQAGQDDELKRADAGRAANHVAHLDR